MLQIIASEGREGVLAVHTRDKPLQEVDLSLVAQQTSGRTGAEGSSPRASTARTVAQRCLQGAPAGPK